MLALLYFFHVFCILTFHSVFHEPVPGSQNAGRAVIYAAALWRLAHSRCEKICSLRVAAPHTALFMTLGLSIVLRAVGFSYIVWLYFFYLYIFLSPLPYLDLLDQNALLCQMQLRDTPYIQRNKQTKKKSDLLGQTKWRCVLKCSLSLSSLCVHHCRLWKPTWHPKTATGSMLTRWGLTQTPVHTCAHAKLANDWCSCNLAAAAALPRLTAKKKKKRAVTSFLFFRLWRPHRSEPFIRFGVISLLFLCRPLGAAAS